MSLSSIVRRKTFHGAVTAVINVETRCRSDEVVGRRFFPFLRFSTAAAAPPPQKPIPNDQINWVENLHDDDDDYRNDSGLIRLIKSKLKRGDSEVITPIPDPLGADGRLLHILQHEINWFERRPNVPSFVIPDRFLFEIQANPKEGTFFLIRNYKDQIIKVELVGSNVHQDEIIKDELVGFSLLSDYVEDDDDQDYVEDDDDQDYVEDDDQDYVEDDAQNDIIKKSNFRSSLSLIVNICKAGGETLELEITAYLEGITIDTCSIGNSGYSEDQMTYDGPNLIRRNFDLQRILHKYLVDRGVDHTLTSFLFKYIRTKDYGVKTYVEFLKAVKGFIEK